MSFNRHCNEQPNQATETPTVEKHAHPPMVVYCAIYLTLTLITKFRVSNFILLPANMPLIRCTNLFYKGDYPVTLLPPPRRLAPSLGLGTTWVRQLRSGSCHYPTAATKCNEQPNQATETPTVEKHAHPPMVVYCAIYLTLTLITKFRVSNFILLPANMPLQTPSRGVPLPDESPLRKHHCRHQLKNVENFNIYASTASRCRLC